MGIGMVIRLLRGVKVKWEIRWVMASVGRWLMMRWEPWEGRKRIGGGNRVCRVRVMCMDIRFLSSRGGEWCLVAVLGKQE